MIGLDSSIHPDNTDLAATAFTELCMARARLWRTGQFGPTGDARSLHIAVDALQGWATQHKLIERLGVDEIQKILAAAFEPVRKDNLP